MAAAQGGRGLMALWKRGWHEIPEVMGAACMASVGLSLGIYAVYNWEYKKGPYYKRFKQEYIVLRDDDPRVKLLRTD